ncbi:uncharacterized protein LOC105749228 isoform X3 [Sarcophilus harrisii]|uniref:uncharacterized protein LOC105749228 isoform X3 n=1 Tax=Sarcophilus harrisii TaxID=9305 RepID=UPI001301A001|nr:uncharacterized protein LOC105749228 isoform X3 [Sarcophilus harrisii]
MHNGRPVGSAADVGKRRLHLEPEEPSSNSASGTNSVQPSGFPFLRLSFLLCIKRGTVRMTSSCPSRAPPHPPQGTRKPLNSSAHPWSSWGGRAAKASGKRRSEARRILGIVVRGPVCAGVLSPGDGASGTLAGSKPAPLARKTEIPGLEALLQRSKFLKKIISDGSNGITRYFLRLQVKRNPGMWCLVKEATGK